MSSLERGAHSSYHDIDETDFFELVADFQSAVREKE